MREAAPRRKSSLAVFAVLLGSIAGCAVGPNYVRPEIETPDLWHQELVRGLEGGEVDLHRWWTAFDDPQLTRLLEQAALGNLDVEIAVARVYEARARRAVARGQWFPGIDNVGSYSRQKLFSEEIAKESGISDISNTVDSLSLGLDASWEIDFFGRVRRATEAAGADLQLQVEDYRGTLVLLLAEVATNYIDVRSLQERIRYAVDNARLQKGTLKLVNDRNRAGLVPDLDVRQAELNLATTESTIPTLRIRLVEAINRLGVLLGQPPSALHGELTEARSVPEPPDRVLVGVPADLLRRRPDIRAAERRLAAQTARIGVATADLYPRFSLLGSFAFTSSDIAKLFSGDAFVFGVGPSFRWNLFDGGRIRGNIEAQDAIAQQELVKYERTVLLALEDLENAMTAYAEERERREALLRSVDAARQSAELVDSLYRSGLTDFLNVLDTQRSLTQQQDRLAESNGLVSTNLVRIYKALGGGWDPDEVGPRALAATDDPGQE